jgi:hypothetical protein
VTVLKSLRNRAEFIVSGAASFVAVIGGIGPGDGLPLPLAGEGWGEGKSAARSGIF